MKKVIMALFALLFQLNVYGQAGIDKPQYQISTTRAGNPLGTFNIELFPLIAPLHVQNFDSLVNDQFYDSTAFHRVVPGFVIQGGDPNTISGPISTWGQGQPWQVTVNAEFSVVRHLRGIIGAARDNDPNSANSQFYICVANATFLDGNYTVFGKVTSGMDIVDTIVNAPRDVNDVPLQKIAMIVTYTGVNDSVPDAPVLNTPLDGSAGVLNTQSFTWSTVNSAVMYTLELSTDPGFSTIDISKNAGINSTIIPTLQGNTTYYWRVKSNNGGHESIYSNIYSFTSASAAATLISPTDSSTGISINPVFEWSAVPGADSYTLQVSTSSTFTVSSMVYNTAGLTSTTQQVNGLNPNTLYYWRVRSANGTVQGFYSVKFTFTTGTSTGIDETSSGINNLSVSPNPADDLITVSAYMNSIGAVKLTLLDQLGREVFQSNPILLSNNLSTNVPVSTLEAGIYFVCLESEGYKIIRKVSIR
ncbi:MAG: peptidylprolyl isomerase [Bacteroidetes bacterium]|nr:peptidylprolyl isomerase [Bacteroidota bacterium]